MKNTKIAWCDMTFNPWMGCAKVSLGCEHCYAEAQYGQRFGIPWGKGQPRKRTSASYWKEPLKWNRASGRGRFRQCPQCSWRGEITDEKDCPSTGCGCVGIDMFVVAPRVFVGSLCDWLDDEAPIEWLADLLDLIRVCRNLDFLLLSKRPENWKSRLSQVEKLNSMNDLWLAGFTTPNIWIGASVENQKRADERIPELLRIPAKVKFLSCEPLLAPIELGYRGAGALSIAPDGSKEQFEANEKQISFVIVGGESGPRAWSMDPNWARSLRDQCKAAGVPFFMKQMSGRTKAEREAIPQDLMIREFPTNQNHP